MTFSDLPLIGITADVSSASVSLAKQARTSTAFVPARYLVAIESAGAIPVVLAPCAGGAPVRRLLSMLNGLVLSGGDFDIHPRYYGEKAMRQLGVIKQSRTAFELEIADAAMNRDLPVLGICGGAQAINVALGGTLYQDLAAQLGARAIKEHTSKNALGHGVQIQPGTRLFEIIRQTRVKVNTSHHQAVKHLGRGLIANALAEDGVVEGIESTRHRFVLGVQWHPEVLAPRQKLQRRIFSAFVEFCKPRSRKR